MPLPAVEAGCDALLQPINFSGVGQVRQFSGQAGQLITRKRLFALDAAKISDHTLPFSRGEMLDFVDDLRRSHVSDVTALFTHRQVRAFLGKLGVSIFLQLQISYDVSFAPLDERSSFFPRW